MGLFVFLWILRSRNYARFSQIKQELFSQDLIKAQEEERLRLARDLHDGVGQKLMLLAKKSRENSNDDVINLAHSTLEELRSIARGLYPATLEKFGISSALRNMIDEMDSNSSILFDYHIESIDEFVDKDTALQFYRIMQEALSNLIKHSQAQEASVSVEKTDKTIKVSISDNGIGFSPAEALNKLTGMGMKTIEERVKIIKGTISFVSKPNSGTQIQLTLPVT